MVNGNCEGQNLKLLINVAGPSFVIWSEFSEMCKVDRHWPFEFFLLGKFCPNCLNFCNIKADFNECVDKGNIFGYLACWTEKSLLGYVNYPTLRVD